MVDVEVKLTSGISVRGRVDDFTPEGLRVSYEADWRDSEFIPFSSGQLSLPKPDKYTSFAYNGQTLRAGDIIEAFIKQSASPGLSGAWQKVQVRDIKGDFLVVEAVEGPPNTDAVTIDKCRLVGSVQPVTAASVHEYRIDVPAELCDYLSDSQSHSDLIETVQGIHVKLLHTRDRPKLVVSSFSAQAISKARVLAGAFLHNARQKMALQQRQEEANRMLSLANNFIEEFVVPADLMGHALGRYHANLNNARSIEGVVSIDFNESTRGIDGYGHFKVVATTPEAVERARTMLEYQRAQMLIPRSMANRLLGMNGRIMRELVEKAHLQTVQVGANAQEQRPQSADCGEDGGGGEEAVPFFLTGKREAIEAAQLFLQYQLKHMREMDEAINDINRKLSSARTSPQPFAFQPFQHHAGVALHPHPQMLPLMNGCGGGGGGGAMSPMPSATTTTATNSTTEISTPPLSAFTSPPQQCPRPLHHPMEQCPPIQAQQNGGPAVAGEKLPPAMHRSGGSGGDVGPRPMLTSFHNSPHRGSNGSVSSRGNGRPQHPRQHQNGFGSAHRGQHPRAANDGGSKTSGGNSNNPRWSTTTSRQPAQKQQETKKEGEEGQVPKKPAAWKSSEEKKVDGAEVVKSKPASNANGASEASNGNGSPNKKIGKGRRVNNGAGKQQSGKAQANPSQPMGSGASRVDSMHNQSNTQAASFQH